MTIKKNTGTTQMQHPRLRIAILECDTPMDSIRAKYGGYGNIFRTLLRSGADALDRPKVISSTRGLDITTWDVVTAQAYPSVEHVDAILLSGSRHNAFEDKPWIMKLVDFITDLLNQDRVRIIGVCFGHQIIGRAMGAKVGRSDAGWETSVMPVELSAKGKELFRQQALSLHQMHRDIVHGYPEGVEELGSSPRCHNQGMFVSKRLMTVQGHPEFNTEIMTELLAFRHDQGIFDDAVYKDSMARVSNIHDGIAVAQGFLRFLLED